MEINYKKVMIYFVTSVILITAVIGICDTPNDEFLLEGGYLLLLFGAMIIQIIILCSKDKTQPAEVQKR